MKSPNRVAHLFSASPQPEESHEVVTNKSELGPAAPNYVIGRIFCRLLLFSTLFGASSQCLAQGGPPVILTQPQGKVVGPGNNVTFTVVVSSVTFPTYQWRFNGTNISGATSTNYAITNVQPSHAGNYSVAVTNAAGAAISFDAVLTIADDVAYVANFSNNTVSVISRTTLGQLGTIPVGTNPYKVVSTPNGQRVFVANQGSDNVSIIDTTSGSVIATLAVGDQPAGIAVSPDSQRLYVVNYGSSNLSVIDTSSNVVITNVTILPNPTSIAYHPARAELWIGYENQGTVIQVRSALDYSLLASRTSFDRSYGTGFAFRPGGSEVFAAESCGCCGRFHRLSGTPSGMTVEVIEPDILYDNTGAAYAVAVNPVSGVAYFGKSGHCGGTPRVYESVSNSITRSLLLPSLPRDMAVDASRSRLWVTLANGTVAVVDTGSLTNVGIVNVGAGPQGIAFAGIPFDAAYVANFNGNTVSVIARATRAALATIPVGTNPHKVVSTPNGQRVFVANQGSDNVSVIDTTSGSVITNVAVGDQPVGMAVSPDSQRLYVANYGSSNISVIDINSNVVITNVPILPHPSSIAYHPARAELWVGYEPVGIGIQVRSALNYSEVATLTRFDRSYGSGFAFRDNGNLVFAAESCGCCGRFHLLSGTPSGMTIPEIEPNILYDNTGAAYAVAVNPVSGVAYFGKSGHCAGGPRVYEFSNSLARSLILPSLPRDMAVDASRNRLWVTLYNGTVAVVDTVSLTNVGIVTVGALAEGIAFAPFTVHNTSVNLSLARFTTNGFQFRLTGPVGIYVFQASTNLVNWISLSTSNAPNGVIDFTDPNVANFSRRFYRARSQ